MDAETKAQEILNAGYTPITMAQAMMDMSAELKALKRQLEASDELILPARNPRICEPSSPVVGRQRLLYSVKYFYDLQRLRIQSMGRNLKKANEAHLTDQDKAFFDTAGRNLKALEKQALKEISGLLQYFPIADWLLEQRGIGPTMAGVIISSFDIHRAPVASSLWRYAGLDVRDGRSPKPVKGERLSYNSWLRTKMVGVLAGSFLKSNSSWRKFYDNYKTRKENQRVDTCMRCNGTGKADAGKCYVCDGGKNKIHIWGKSDAHRHHAALRYMTKMFLSQLYCKWRTIENLPVREPYAEEYLGMKHHEKIVS